AMIANMAPETGATMLYFPVDEVTLDYLRLTGRDASLVELVEAFTQAQHLYHSQDAAAPAYSRILKLDLASIEPSVAGPKRPQDRLPLSRVKPSFAGTLSLSRTEGGFGVPAEGLQAQAKLVLKGEPFTLKHGSLVLAAITSCTNTSNPHVLLAAGLLAQKALARGLKSHPWVKASLSPGSRVVTAYLQAAGLLEPLEALGFSLAGYGCMTCIGNSGPLAPEIAAAIRQHNLVTAAVLSGNRNFEGRVNSHIQANYLASPPLVVAFALAGRVNIDLEHEPLGYANDGSPVYLKDIWPERHEIEALIQAHVTPGLFSENDRALLQGNTGWAELQGAAGAVFSWDEESTYIQEPPFFEAPATAGDIRGARVLAFLGDSVTTDHISPAGSIPPASPAGQYLQGLGVPPAGFNSYGSRRANDRVLTRATLANTRLKNRLAKGKEGGYTSYLPGRELMTLYDAAMRYQAEGVPLVILAGMEYGSGSSRDWAAKGVQQLGVRAVIAESFERIHRSNLAGMGVLPLQFLPGKNAESYQLSGEETFTVEGISALSTPGEILRVQFTRPDGTGGEFAVRVRLDTQNELDFYRQGGMLPALLRSLLKPNPPANRNNDNQGAEPAHGIHSSYRD
ncbi:MAG: aconitate hydratase AcnA, partial [bacterium]